MTMICVPILADDPAIAKRDAILAGEMGADIVEFRVDLLMELEESLESRIAIIKNLVEESALPCIVTCRPEWEGGMYSGDEDERVSMFEAIGTAEHPPAYIDVELKAYQASANIKQKINLAVDHPKQQRSVRTRLILSTHDFEGRPSDLTRRLIAMHDEPACAVVKVAYRARSIRDNLELFDILSERQKPTIALGMGEFGTMSRVLAPKFGAFLTFASLRDASATASGQPTIEELLGMYRFRSIKASTKVYGIIGWPVTQSMSPLVHNAGFDAIGWDGVYVPMPVAASDDKEASLTSLTTTLGSLLSAPSLQFAGASVTIPHKENLWSFAIQDADDSWPLSTDYAGVIDGQQGEGRAYNTISIDWVKNEINRRCITSTDIAAVRELVTSTGLDSTRVCVVGAGGVAKSTIRACKELELEVFVACRRDAAAQQVVTDLAIPSDRTRAKSEHRTSHREFELASVPQDQLSSLSADIYINCTPVGMAGGPDPDGLSIPIPDLPPLPPETVFFDTVYNPIETPMLREAKKRGYRTIDGVQMFVKQAEAQFELWTGQNPPEGLFDRLVRTKLTTEEKPDA